jgi:hypothetical protein
MANRPHHGAQQFKLIIANAADTHWVAAAENSTVFSVGEIDFLTRDNSHASLAFTWDRKFLRGSIHIRQLDVLSRLGRIVVPQAGSSETARQVFRRRFISLPMELFECG